MDLRVAVFTDIYRPRIGGTTVSVTNTVAGLRAANVPTFLFAPSPAPKEEEVDAVWFPTMRLNLGGTSIRTAVPYVPRIAAELTQAQVRVVHSFSPFFVGHVARRLARRQGVPTVFTHQTRYEEYLHYLPFGRKLLNVARAQAQLEHWTLAATRKVCNAFDCVIVPTQTMASRLRELGVTRRIEILPAGFDISRLTEGPSEVRTKLGISLSSILFLHIGRLSPEKNVTFLLEAFALALGQCGNDAHLLVVGDGPERARLQRLADTLGISARVNFIGSIPNQSIGPYFRAADAFLFSSLSDVQALVICEALVAGLPVVAVRAPGPSDFVRDGQEGLLTGLNRQEFASAICRMVSNSALRQSLAARAHEAGQQFSLERYTTNLIHLYQDLVVSHG